MEVGGIGWEEVFGGRAPPLLSTEFFLSVFLVHFRNPLDDAGEDPYAAGDVQDEGRIDQVFREFEHESLLAGLQGFGGVNARRGGAVLRHLVDDEQCQAVEADADEVGGDAEGLAEHLVAPQEAAHDADGHGGGPGVGRHLAPEQPGQQRRDDRRRPQLEDVDHQAEHVLEQDGDADGNAAHEQGGHAGLAQHLILRGFGVDELVVDVAGVHDAGGVDEGRAGGHDGGEQGRQHKAGHADGQHVADKVGEGE